MAESSLKQQITTHMKDAMRSRDKMRLGTIRMALAEIKRVEVDERTEVDDARVLTILERMLKQRRESIRQYEAAGRPELAEQEQKEIQVLQDFMPEPIGDAELHTIIKNAVIEAEAKHIKDMGKVMAMVKPQVAGRADMAAVSQEIKKQLNS